jgi:glycosidase
MKKVKALIIGLLISLLLFASLDFTNISFATETDSQTFSWDNATVYFVMTDRFLDEDPTNNHSYGRELDRYGNPYADYKNKVGTFHGGDFAGLTQRLNEGYFTDLGINAIWITAPFEQMHGWVGGLNFRHYGYHGYYTLDYTEVDKNLGTEDDLRNFIDTAHENGIRVIFDVIMNHPGYLNMKDMAEFGYGELLYNWDTYYYDQPESYAHYDTYDDYIGYTSYDLWSKWWGPEWIRTSPQAPGYDEGGYSDLTLCLSNLPDFKTESTNWVGLPAILSNKWDNSKESKEMNELNNFFSRTGKPRTPSNYLIKWLSDWVREYGVDGFRCDTAKHVDLHVWNSLKQETKAALREWKSNNPDKKLDDLDFWMTGEVWGHDVNRSEYFDNGFDSIINFSFQNMAGNLDSLKWVYPDYASKINSNDGFNVLSYISSHDTSLFDRNNLINAGTSLLLLPGGVQIYYGDETARQPNNSLPWDQPTRTDMNWNSINSDVLSHWQKLGQFRNKHIAIGAGTHTLLQESPHVFSRVYSKNGIYDNVVVAIGASGNTTIGVSDIFPNGATVRDFYTGNEAVVSNGYVTFTAHPNKVILLEAVDDISPDEDLTVYFKKPSGWESPQLYYYGTNPKVAEPQWDCAPEMEPDIFEDWYVYTISGAQSARVIFKDSYGNQIPGANQPGFLRSGTGWFMNGIWYSEQPEAGGENTLTVYYKKGFNTPYMHHQNSDGNWTTAPGDLMTESQEYPGYCELTIDMGNRNQIEAVFTDGQGNWDNNDRNNYIFGPGVFTFQNGEITPGEPPSRLMVQVKFAVNNAYISGSQKLYIVGSIPELGNWACNDCPGPAEELNDGRWEITIELPVGTTFEFKAIKKSSSGYVTWEGGANHSYTVPESGDSNVVFYWNY